MQLADRLPWSSTEDLHVVRDERDVNRIIHLARHECVEVIEFRCTHFDGIVQALSYGGGNDSLTDGRAHVGEVVARLDGAEKDAPTDVELGAPRRERRVPLADVRRGVPCFLQVFREQIEPVAGVASRRVVVDSVPGRVLSGQDAGPIG